MLSMLRFIRIGILFAGCGCLNTVFGTQQDIELIIFAAASLSEPLTTIGNRYEKETRTSIRYSFASSSTLARQIEAGAAPNLFISASSHWVDYLNRHGLIKADSRVALLSNEIVVAAPIASPLNNIVFNRDVNLVKLLKPGERIAIGDPDHVPAGMYAKLQLEQLGLWTEVAANLARADNTRAALALVERGEAPIGFVYRTDALISSRVKIVATVPSSRTDPITYEVAVPTTANSDARGFYNYLLSEKSQEIFLAFGFKTYRQ